MNTNLVSSGPVVFVLLFFFSTIIHSYSWNLVTLDTDVAKLMNHLISLSKANMTD